MLCHELLRGEMEVNEAIQILEALGAKLELTLAWLILCAIKLQKQIDQGFTDPNIVFTWIEAVNRMFGGGFVFLANRERGLVFKLVAYFISSKNPEASRTSKEILNALLKIQPPPLRIEMLGGLRVWVGGLEIPSQTLQQRRAGELLALLAIIPGHQLSIDEVIDAICPDKGLQSARMCFHHASSTLRRILEPDIPDKRFPSRYLEIGEERAILNMPSGSSTDYLDFLMFCEKKEYQLAYPLYQGELLLEYRFSPWSEVLRTRITAAWQECLLALANQALVGDDPATAGEYAQKLIELDSLNENAIMISMQAKLDLGDRSGALRLYQEFNKELKHEWDIEPQEALKSFYRSIIEHRESI